MAYIGIDPWRDTLISQLPGVSENFLKLTFWNVARDFYLRSRSWRESLGPFTLRPGVGEIAISPVDQSAEVCYLEDVWMPGYPLYMRVEHSMAFFHEGHSTGIPVRFALADPHTLCFSPLPDQVYDRALWLVVSAQPKRGAERLPGFAQTHHFRALELGTLSAMRMMSGKPWSDPGNGTLDARRFEVAIAAARSDAERQWTKEHGAWSFHAVPVR